MELNKTLAEIASLVKGKIIGDDSLLITGLSGIKEAQEGDLTFLANSKYTSLANATQASAILVNEEIALKEKSFILVDNPSLAFGQIISAFADTQRTPIKGIHASAVIAEDAILGKDVVVGANVVIESKVSVGDKTIIEAGSFIGEQTSIGKNCHVYPNVTIQERISIGHEVTIHSGAVIGSDGFGFEEVNGEYSKIPQIGTVVIEDQVEIGANVTIDRARFDKTFIGRGTKIDNLVQIAHNVTIGENCIIVAQVGISGSVDIEKGVILAGQAGVAGHLTIGEGAIVAAQAGVTKSVPPKTQVSGYPALPHDEAIELHARLKRLPGYVETIKNLEKRVEELEAKYKNGK